MFLNDQDFESSADLTAQVIELAKGKRSIEVENAQALIKALETVKQAVEAGELDTQIENAGNHLRSGFRKS